MYPPPSRYFKASFFKSHLFNQPFGGGWSAHIMPAASISSRIKHVHPHSYKVLFFKERQRKINTIILFLAAHAYLCIQVLHCFEESCPFFPHHRKFKKASVSVQSLSHEGCLCLYLLKGLFTLHILLSSALICSRFKVFHPNGSSPPWLCQSTILLSHFPQLRQWAHLPWRWMTDRSTVLATSIQRTGGIATWLGFFSKKKLWKTKESEKECRAERKDIIVVCFSSSNCFFVSPSVKHVFCLQPWGSFHRHVLFKMTKSSSLSVPLCSS